jgi:nitroreductase
MELSQALRSTGAVRDFTDEPVSDDVVYRLLDTARFAPNGGNRQAWHVIVVRDPATRVALRDLYLPGWYEYLPQMEAGLTPFAAVTDRDAEAAARTRAPEFAERGATAPGFAERLHEVPLLVVLTADLRNLATLDRDLDRYTLVGGASIYPFAWSLLLAAHDVGLGGVITTVAIREEPALRALLRLPEHVVVAAVLAFGYPAGRRATKLRRNPVEEFATVDRYDGPAVTPG